MTNLRLLSAFQALEMMQQHGFRKAYGVNKTRAKAIILELSGIKVGRMKVQGPSLEDYVGSVGYAMGSEEVSS